MIQDVIARLFAKQSLSAAEAEAAMGEVMSGAATQAQIGAYLAALRMKGETQAEITGSARAMRAKSMRVPVKRAGACIDTCGTGGDKSGTFNISTTTAFVVAGAGVPVAKHGNRAATSQSGSADVLSALGVNVAITPEQAGQCIDEVGIGFMLAPTHHPAMKNVAGPRREIGARTIFNILGPLTNPAGAKHQLLGVFDAGYVHLMANVLHDLGSERAMVVSGRAGDTHVDELLTTGPNSVSELKDGAVREYTLDATDLGLTHATLDDLGGGTPDFNAAITRGILAGTDVPARMDVVLLNAAAALYVAGCAADLKSGVQLARESIASGAAAAKLDALIALSQTFIPPTP